MAKITIAGDAVVVTSTLKLEDIKTVAKYRPDALVLKGGEDGKEPIFAVGVTEGTGNINEYGASFGRESHGAEKLAIITMGIGDVVGDVKEYVADSLGRAVVNLGKLEAQLPAVLEAIAAEKTSVMANIVVAQ